MPKDDPDPTTAAGWTERFKWATRRMKRVLGKIDHDRRMALIIRDIDGTATAAEKAELEALQQACDEALLEHDGLLIRYQRWRIREIGGEALLELLERGTKED
jgi:hypothetical protein